MKNKTNTIDRIKLMMSYDSKKTLNENLNVLRLISEDKSIEVDEQREVIKKELKNLGLGARETSVIVAMGKEFGIADNIIATALTKDLTTLSKELENAVALDFKDSVRVSTTNTLGPAAKQASKLKAMKEMVEKSKELKAQGKNLTTKQIEEIIERTKNESKEIARRIESGKLKVKGTGGKTKGAAPEVENVTVDGIYLKGNTINGPVTLTQNFAADTRQATATLKQDAKVLEGEAKIAAEESAAVVEGIKPNAWQKLKNAAKKLNKKWLWRLGLLAGAAGVGYAIYKYYGGKSNDKISPCLTDLLEKDEATCSATTAGDPVVIVKTTGDAELDSKGGVQFYMGGGKQRVLTADQTKRGNFSCKNGTIQTTISEEETSGYILQNIQLDWDVAPTKTDDTKPPIPNPNPKVEPSYFDCSKRDVTKDNLEWGCIHPALAKLQACYGITPSKGYFGPKTYARLGGKIITPEQYARLMKEKNCYGSDTTTDVTTTGQTQQSTISTTYGDAGDTGVPTENPSVTQTDSGQGTETQSGEMFSTGRLELWDTLISNYNKRDDEGNPTYPFLVKSGNRIKYKGLMPSADDLAKLDSMMDVKRYGRIKQNPEKGYGTKYVWEKRKK